MKTLSLDFDCLVLAELQKTVARSFVHMVASLFQFFVMKEKKKMINNAVEKGI